MATLLDGKKLSQTVRAKVAERAAAFEAKHGRKPGLEVVLVGEDPASQVYTRSKEKAALEAGIRGKLHKLPATTTEAELLALLDRLNGDDTVDGILVQLPLPKQITEQKVLDAVRADKDVDGFHPINAGLLASGRPGLVPCTPTGCMHLIATTGIDLAGTVTALKRETAKDIYIFGSAALCGELMPHGVIDEYRIGICPVMLGSGTPLFKPLAERIKLKLTDSRPLSTGIVINRYVPQT